MTPRDKAILVVSLSGLLAIILVAIAGRLGFAYWWPTFWVVAVATTVGIIWIDERSLAKAFAVVTLVAVGVLGWAVPISSTNSETMQGFSMTPFFWAAGVTLWRVAPFGLAILIARLRPPRS